MACSTYTGTAKTHCVKWEKKYAAIETRIDNYKTLYDSVIDRDNLRDRMLLSNKVLTDRYRANQNDDVTDDRKAYYEMQGTDNLQWYYYWMKWGYITMVLIFIVASIMAPTTYSVRTRGALTAMLVLYPIVISFVAVATFASIRALLQMLPYNTYTNSIGVSPAETPDAEKPNMSNTYTYAVPELSSGLKNTVIDTQPSSHLVI
jgi:hypothetical protein